MSGDTARPEGVRREDEFAFLFAQLVLQQSNMALMLLGKVAHPEAGKLPKDVEAARLFIDQLEMLEAKTKGNLSKEEEAFLKQTLMNLRLSFVQAVESPAPSEQKQTNPAEAVPQASSPTESSGSAAGSESGPTADDDHRKKFSKKY